MPGLQGEALAELPQKLQRTLADKKDVQGKGADISESVVHTAMMGLLLMASEVKPGEGTGPHLPVGDGGIHSRLC